VANRIAILIELIEAERAHQAEGDQRSRQNRRGVEQARAGQSGVGAVVDGGQGDQADAGDVEAAEIIDALPGRGALAGVQPDVRAKGAAPRASILGGGGAGRALARARASAPSARGSRVSADVMAAADSSGGERAAKWRHFRRTSLSKSC
jgi:hypothetical protein